MSSQMFEYAPSVFGGQDPNLLQTANRVLIGGPVDLFDLTQRTGDAAMRGAGEAVEYATGLPGIRRDIYGLLTVGGIVAGSSPSSLSRPSLSSRKADVSPPPSTAKTLPAPENSGIMQALDMENLPVQAANVSDVPFAPAITKKPDIVEGEIVSGPSDRYLQLQAKRDQAQSKPYKDMVEEQMAEEAIRDATQDIAGYVDDELDYLFSIAQDDPDFRFVARDSDEFFDEIIQESVAQHYDNGVPMADALLNEVGSVANRLELEYGYPVLDTKRILDTIAPKLDEYGFGVSQRLRQMDEGAKAREMMERRARAARMQNQRNKEYAMNTNIREVLANELNPPDQPARPTLVVIEGGGDVATDASKPQLVTIEGGKDID
jgi:hypothetical protein